MLKKAILAVAFATLALGQVEGMMAAVRDEIKNQLI